MKFELFLPYLAVDVGIDDRELENYYKTEKEYVGALHDDDEMYGATIYNTMTHGGMSGGAYYGAFSSDNLKSKYMKESDRLVYAKSSCVLYDDTDSRMETVDSIIDKFVSRRPFLIVAELSPSTMDSEFEEEIREWSRATLNILKYSRDLQKKNGKQFAEDFLENNIPKKDMRISFINKSAKEVRFVLHKCEIEKKISRNRYMFFVSSMSIIN